MSEQIVFDYEDIPTIRLFASSRERHRLVVGPYGSAKSSGCAIEIYSLACEQAPNIEGVRKTRWAVVRSTYAQLTDTTMKTFFEWIPEENSGSAHRQLWRKEFRYLITDDLPNGTRLECEILFRALDNPKHVRDLKSLELTGAWFNELCEIPKIFFDHMDGRIGRFPSMRDGVGCSWCGTINDSNPCADDHWMYELYENFRGIEESERHNYEVFHQPSGLSEEAENLKHLMGGRKYYENLARGKSPEFIKVFVHGMYGFVSDGKPVFTNYLDEFHCAKHNLEPIKSLPLIIGLDFDLNSAAAICQYLPNGQFRPIDEIATDGIGLRSMLNDCLKPLLRGEYQGLQYRFTGDPAGNNRSGIDANTCYKEMRKNGFNIVRPKTNYWQPRYNSIDSLLTKRIVGSEPAFLLSPKCKVIRAGMKGKYLRKRIPVVGREMFKDEPDKNCFESHVIDGMMYSAMMIDGGAQNATNPFGNPDPIIQTPRRSAWW
jgi:hypothetical protein